MIYDSFMQSVMHLSVELQLLPQGTIPSAVATGSKSGAASATPIGMPSGIPMLFDEPLHCPKQDMIVYAIYYTSRCRT